MKFAYFHPRLALSYKRPYTFIVGVRGVGKTYSMTKFLVKKALETHSLYFMWLRVAKTELDNCKNEFFSDMEKDNCFPNYTFRVVGNYGYAKDLTTHEEFAICYFNFIKASQDIKGTPLPTIQYIVCDEFIEESTSPYKKMLIDTFSICESVFRLRRVKCIFLGNAVTMENVFFKYFKIKDINRPFTKGKQYVIENTAYEDIYKGYMKAHEESDNGKITKNSDYGSYANNNDFMLDNLEGVIDLKINYKWKCLIGIKLDSGLVGVYSDNNGVYFVERKKFSEMIVTPYTTYAKNDIIYLRYTDELFKNLFSITNRKKCYFTSLSIKNEINTLKEKCLGNLKIN